MRYLYITILLSISITTFAQKDKIYLENGSKIRGTVQQYPLKDSVIVDIGDSTILSIPIDIIDEVRFKKRNRWRPEGYKDLTYPQGWSTAVKAGFLMGNHSYSEPVKAWLAVEFAQEYHYHPLLNGGLGLGINYYKYYTVFPVFVEYQAVLGKRHKSLYVYGKFGHGFITDRHQNDYEVQGEKGGRIAGAGIGWQKRVGDDYFRIKIGYLSQVVTERSEPQWGWGWSMPSPDNYVIKKRFMNRIKIGIEYVLR